MHVNAASHTNPHPHLLAIACRNILARLRAPADATERARAARLYREATTPCTCHEYATTGRGCERARVALREGT